MRAHNLKWLKGQYMHPNVTVSGKVCTNPVFCAHVWMQVTCLYGLVWVCACSPMWLLSEGSDWWWGMERIRNTLGCEWGVSRRVTLAQNTAASHIITLITLMRTTLRATKRLDSLRLAQEHKHKGPHIPHSIPHRDSWRGTVPNN